MSNSASMALRHLLAASTLALAPLAHAVVEVEPAAYFVRPYVQLDAVSHDGLDQGGATQASVNIDTRVAAEVDLSTGSTGLYLQLTGPGQFGQAAGVMGDRLTLVGGAGNVDFWFDFDGSIGSNVGKLGTEALQIGVVANLRVFDTAAGATAANFAGLAGALVSHSLNLDFNNPAQALDETLSESLFGSYSFAGGMQALDVFASLSIFTAANNNPIVVTMDFSHTGSLSLDPAAGIVFSSESGVFPGSQALPVPEPGSWALMLAGLGLVGGLAQRRSAQVAAAATGKPVGARA